MSLFGYFLPADDIPFMTGGPISGPIDPIGPSGPGPIGNYNNECVFFLIAITNLHVDNDSFKQKILLCEWNLMVTKVDN